MKLLDTHPNFHKLNEDDARTYLSKFISIKVKSDNALLKRVPASDREDVSQDIFIDLWNNRFDYNPDRASFNTYAYLRCLFVIKKYFDSLKREAKARKDLKARLEESYTINYENKISIIEKIQYLLTEKDFEIARMYYYDNMTVEEISNIREVTETWVYFVLNKIKRIAKNILENPLENPSKT